MQCVLVMPAVVPHSKESLDPIIIGDFGGGQEWEFEVSYEECFAILQKKSFIDMFAELEPK